VGIGLAVPATPLHVAGNATLGNSVAATNVSLLFNGVASKAKRLVFKSGGTEDWLIGMGAASETDAFEIYNGNGQMALSFAKATSNATFVSNIGVGNATPTTSGTGITFPATQSASSNANTLDDYEEGTFTPTLVVDSGTPAYQYQQGYYTKIGRQVFGGGIIGITNSNTLTGTIKVSVPFTISAGSYGYTGGFTSDGSGFTWPVTQAGNSFYAITLQAGPGENSLSFTGVGSTATPVGYQSSGVAANWYFRYSFSFYT
jgi:hypothetical protein